MIPAGGGTILLTGASASVKGYPNSSSFALGKFGLRGLAQSLARELQPQNIHVGHFIIDGGILLLDGEDKRAERLGEDGTLNPDEIAKSPICRSTASTAAPGPGKWNFAPGWRNSSRYQRTRYCRAGFYAAQ